MSEASIIDVEYIDNSKELDNYARIPEEPAGTPAYKFTVPCLVGNGIVDAYSPFLNSMCRSISAKNGIPNEALAAKIKDTIIYCTEQETDATKDNRNFDSMYQLCKDGKVLALMPNRYHYKCRLENKLGRTATEFEIDDYIAKMYHCDRYSNGPLAAD